MKSPYVPFESITLPGYAYIGEDAMHIRFRRLLAAHCCFDLGNDLDEPVVLESGEREIDVGRDMAVKNAQRCRPTRIFNS